MRLISGVKRMVAAGMGITLMMAVLLPQATAQVATTTVQGTVYRADGSIASGTLLVRWPAFSTAENQAVAAGSISTVIGPNGFVSLNLAPNSGAYPAGTYYTAVYHLNDGTVSREYWVVPAVASTSISSIRSQLAPATVAVQPVSKSYVDDSIAAITGNYVPLAGGTMSGPLQLSGDPVSENQASTKHYADALAATELPLTGGSLSGTLNTQNTVTKLPRVDVRHPDFGAGCANAADPTGQEDSTCAIQAAIAWAQANKQGVGWPEVYFPAGTYKISSNLDIPCALRISGDSTSTTTLEEVNNTAGITIDGTIGNPNPLSALCTGDVDHLSIYTPNNHSYTATQLELLNAVGYKLWDVRVAGGAGRGITLIGNTERVKAYDIEIDQVRWPLLWGGNENHLWGLQINGAGQDGSNYCWSVNCVNGVAPSYFEWASGGVLVSANGNGTTASFYVYNSNATYPGTSPIIAGHHFVVAGTTGTVLDGTYVATSVTNHVTSDPSSTCSVSYPCFEVQAASTMSGTATVSGATWKPAWLPDRTAAVFVAGQNVLIDGGSIKTLWYAGGFELQSVTGGEISHIYTEGYPLDGRPQLDSSLVEGGDPTVTSLTTAMTSGGKQTVTVASCLWSHGFANTAAGAQLIGGPVTLIEPQDFVAGSTSPSAYVPGVEQGQYEIVYAACSVNDNYYVNTRNVGGSTAPANTAWPVGSIVAETTSGGYGTFTLDSDHFNAIAGAGSNWAADCQDNGQNVCAEVVIGNIPNGYSSFTTAGGQPPFWARGSLTILGGDWYAGATELTGEGWIKARGHGGAIEVLQNEPISGAYGYQAINGNLTPPAAGAGLPYFLNVQEADGSYPNASVYAPESGLNYNSGDGIVKTLAQGGDVVTGNDPGNSSSSNQGIQFSNSYCQYDLPISSGTHSLNRWCAKGGPNNTGTSSGWEYDVWNGSAWVNAFGISAQSNSTANAAVSGSLTAAEINNEVTVDGVTYTNVNAVWNAAVALADSSGRNQTVRLGPGMYSVSATMTEPTNGACVNLIGSGGTTVNAGSSAATTLTVPTSLGGDVFYLGNAAQAQGCTFRDFVLLANANATHGFELQWFRGLLIDNVAVNDTTAEGILLGEESTSAGHQANFLMRNVTVSYNVSLFTPADRPAYGVHLQKTAIDSYMDDIVVRNALTAAVYNEGTGNTGYLVHGFGYPYTCTSAPCANNASSSTAASASYATSYVIDDVGGGGSVWTDTYADSPAVAGFYIGANGVAIHGGHIQWPDLTSFPAANLAYVAAGVTNDMLIADVSCLGMNSNVNWITYAGAAGDPPTFSTVHNLTGCGNYVQDLNPAQVTGFSSGGANINDPSGAVPRVWATPIAAASSYPAFSAQLYSGYQGDVLQGHFSGTNPFFNVTYQGTIKSNGGLALSTVLNTASTLTLTAANKNVIANAVSGAQTITLPSCYTAWPDKATPTGLELTIIKSDTSANAVTLQTVSSQQINYAGAWSQTLSITSPGKRTLVCGPDYNWYAY